jgi:YidC/Oxa1 family membrane protein insertase
MEENKSFLDKNTLLAIGLAILIWVGWDYYMVQKYGPTRGAPIAQGTPAPSATEQPLDIPAQTAATPTEAKTITMKAEELTTVDNENVSFSISTKGMGLKNILLKKYKDRNKEPIQFFNGTSIAPFETTLSDGQPIFFTIEKITDNTYVGTYSEAGVTIKKIYEINADTYTVQSKIEVTSTSGETPAISNFLVDESGDEPNVSIFNPSFERQEVFVYANNSKERHIYHAAVPLDKNYENVAIASLNSHYFATAMIDKSPLIPSLKTYQKPAIKTGDRPTSYAELSYASVKQPSIELNYTSYLGPKKMSILTGIDERFANVVDFGMFSFIAKPILKLLQVFYDMFKNYGVAIILLTILVRLLVLPFNVMSYKSMKGMQKIQPMLTELREKYKDNPTKLNQEMMGIFKEHKVNPMGGCLPMLLQLPIFLALYQVLGQSIELYQSPFILWISDLSLKDPFYVLPVLMGITMYLQQKWTPSTLDPTQQKVMAIMPVIFTAMMVALPSGLTLYIFVSTLFAVIQQKILMSRP